MTITENNIAPIWQMLDDTGLAHTVDVLFGGNTARLEAMSEDEASKFVARVLEEHQEFDMAWYELGMDREPDADYDEQYFIWMFKRRERML